LTAESVNPKQAAVEVGKGQPQAQARRFLGPIALAGLILFIADAWVVQTQGFNTFDRANELFVQGFPWGPLVYVFAAVNWSGQPQPRRAALIPAAKPKVRATTCGSWRGSSRHQAATRRKKGASTVRTTKP